MTAKDFAKLIIEVIEDEAEKYGDAYALDSIMNLCVKTINKKD